VKNFEFDGGTQEAFSGTRKMEQPDGQEVRSALMAFTQCWRMLSPSSGLFRPLAHTLCGMWCMLSELRSTLSDF
jgi:hypothetical protein